MNKNDALVLLDKISQFVPLTHDQHELLAKSFQVLISQEGNAKEALSVVDQVVKAAPLVRAEYELSRRAVQFLAQEGDESAA